MANHKSFPKFAGMKAKCFVIGVIVLFAFFACTSKVKAPEPAVPEANRSIEEPSPELSAIDSLMWQRPDSALACLLPYFDTCEDEKFCVSTATAYNRHYANLLLAELLYKNDYAQVNRAELLQAVVYFDSLVVDDASIQNIAFLDARAHYINGVGYYEQDSLVPACAEYLKTLEVMEDRFAEKDLVGHKARFMAYTYNRLGDMFSEQFMMESAINCYENALVYCRIEPTSPTGVSNILYRIGKQYDKMDEIEKVEQYYDQALEIMTDTGNLVYRNIVSSKALCDYLLGKDLELTLKTLKQILIYSNDDEEQLTRFLTIGAIFTEEGKYDSALHYLEPVLEDEKDVVSQIQAAECLRIIYDSVGNDEKLNKCLHFLALQKKSEGQNKALVSQLEDMFKKHNDQKQEKYAEEARKKSIRKTIEILVPIAIVVALVIYILVKLRGKKLLRQQQAEAEKVLEETNLQHEEELKRWQAETEQQLEETERKHKQKMEEIAKRHVKELRVQKDRSEKEIEKTKKRHEEELDAERIAYQNEQEALHRSLQEREEQVDALEKALYLQREEAELRREAFLKEAICCKINDSVRSLYITAREGARKNVTLTEEDSSALREAVSRHYENFESFLLSKNPKMSKDDIQLCQLYLLGLDERQIAVLQCKTYSAIKKRAAVLKGSIGIAESLSAYILKFSTFGETS